MTRTDPSLPKFLRKLWDNYPEQISEIDDEGLRGGGYWIYLKDGWYSTLDDCHIIHEFRAKDLRERMEHVARCHCEKCGEPPLERWELHTGGQEHIEDPHHYRLHHQAGSGCH